MIRDHKEERREDGWCQAVLRVPSPNSGLPWLTAAMCLVLISFPLKILALLNDKQSKHIIANVVLRHIFIVIIFGIMVVIVFVDVIFIVAVAVAVIVFAIVIVRTFLKCQ